MLLIFNINVNTVSQPSFNNWGNMFNIKPHVSVPDCCWLGDVAGTSLTGPTASMSAEQKFV